jgi:hypothetical protein
MDPKNLSTFPPLKEAKVNGITMSAFSTVLGVGLLGRD